MYQKNATTSATSAAVRRRNAGMPGKVLAGRSLFMVLPILLLRVMFCAIWMISD